MNGLITYVRRHHVGLLALVIVCATSTAYAAGLAKNSVKSRQIKNGSVRSVDVADGGLTGIDIADGGLLGADLAGGSVGTGQLADGAATASKIGDGAISGVKLGNGAVLRDKVADGAIDETKIADGAVGAAQIAEGAVNGAKIADGTVGAAELDPDSVADVISRSNTLPNDSSSHDLLVVPGFGTMRLSCTAPTGFSAFYALNSTDTESADLFGTDLLDNTPVGAAGITGTSGGVGYSGSGITRMHVEVHASTAARVLRIELYATPGGSFCPYWLEAVVDHNDA